ncbi:hypothetical protein ACFO5Q_04875 [Kordiimonas lipolytica]|uniref:Uncharacterized protein n=1 Tax=Kordiimonas lipolytica TaxID=1662421 RepID=A0ABV8U962_9PROT|nr:hypothetical protein [Kordiimonas lipolytica]
MLRVARVVTTLLGGNQDHPENGISLKISVGLKISTSSKNSVGLKISVGLTGKRKSWPQVQDPGGQLHSVTMAIPTLQ